MLKLKDLFNEIDIELWRDIADTPLRSEVFHRVSESIHQVHYFSVRHISNVRLRTR